MATIDSLTLKATPLGTDTIELNDGQKATLASLPVTTAQTADTVAKIATHAALTDTHGAVSTATADRIALRDASAAASFGGVDLDTATIASAFKAGRFRWNDTYKTAEIDLESGTTLQLGQEQVLRARNTTGGTLANGAAVYINGASGNLPTVAAADADTLTHAETLIGLVTVTSGIANNSNGFVTTFGKVRELNTSAFAEGAVLYLSDGSAGTYTATKPTAAGSSIVRVGFVVRSHVTQGEILVAPAFLGSVTGNAVFTATSQSAARTALGSTATGDAVFTATSATAARTAIDAVAATSGQFTNAPTVNFGITAPSVGTEIGYKWGIAGSAHLAFERGEFEGVEDRVVRLGYRAGENPAVGDVRGYWQFEQRFKNGTAYDSEIHFSWFGPTTGLMKRPWQANLSWGPGFSTDGQAEGQTTQAFDATQFRFGNLGGFDDKIVFEFPSDQPDLYAWPKANSKDARIRVARVGGTEWLQMLAGGGGTLGGGANNLLSLDSVSATLGSNRGLNIRRSINGGSTFTNMLQIRSFETVPRFVFGEISDDGSTPFQFSGEIRNTYSGAGTVVAGFGSAGTCVSALVGASGGGFLQTQRTSTELLRIGSGRNDSGTGLNNGHAIDIIGPNARPLWFRTSSDGVTYTPRFVVEQSNIALGTSDGFFGSYGGGVRCFYIQNAASVPTTNPVGGGILYVEGGALKYRGSSGTVTTLGNA